MPEVYHSTSTASVWKRFSQGYVTKVMSVTSFADMRARLLGAVKKGVVLDAGCGPLGLLLRDVSRMASTRAVGFDFCEAMIRESRRLTTESAVAYAVADLRQLPLPNRSLDTMLAVNSFIPETRQEVDAMFHEASRVIKRSGRLVAVLPSFEMSFVARDRWGMPLKLDLKNQREWDTSGWQCFYTAAEIAKLMHRHGFAHHRIEALTLSTPAEITHIKQVYAEGLTNVPHDRLVTDPLFEHLLVAER